MNLNKKTSTRSQLLWRGVMREGRSIDEIAREQQMSPSRVERVLLGLSKRRASSFKPPF